MTHVSRPSALDEPADDPIAQRLAADIRAAGLTIRGLAKKLTGDNATQAQIDTQRSQVREWLGGKPMRAATAARVAEALGHQADRYLIERPRRKTREELEAELAEVRRLLALRLAGEGLSAEERAAALRAEAEALEEETRRLEQPDQGSPRSETG